MTDNDRLEALKAKVEGMGFELRKTCVFGSMDFNEDLQDYEIVGNRWRLWFQEDNSDIAETLLAALDPKAVRVAGNIPTDKGKCAQCLFFDGWKCGLSDCIDPAPDGYERVLVERKVMQ